MRILAFVPLFVALSPFPSLADTSGWDPLSVRSRLTEIQTRVSEIRARQQAVLEGSIKRNDRSIEYWKGEPFFTTEWANGTTHLPPEPAINSMKQLEKSMPAACQKHGALEALWKRLDAQKKGPRPSFSPVHNFPTQFRNFELEQKRQNERFSISQASDAKLQPVIGTGERSLSVEQLKAKILEDIRLIETEIARFDEQAPKNTTLVKELFQAREAFYAARTRKPGEWNKFIESYNRSLQERRNAIRNRIRAASGP